MRLWHYKLIPVLPDKMLVSQWRECLAIKRGWEKGTLNHRLVNYVMNYDKEYFSNYVFRTVNELVNRKIRYNKKYLIEIFNFSNGCPLYNLHITPDTYNYKEHNDRYLKQCYYNLQEKADRGIVSSEEWQKIEDLFKSEVE